MCIWDDLRNAEKRRCNFAVNSLKLTLRIYTVRRLKYFEIPIAGNLKFLKNCNFKGILIQKYAWNLRIYFKNASSFSAAFIMNILLKKVQLVIYMELNIW